MWIPVLDEEEGPGTGDAELEAGGGCDGHAVADIVWVELFSVFLHSGWKFV